MAVWQIWVVTAIALFVIEIFTPSFVLACFGISALTAGTAAYFSANLQVQIAVFAAATFLLFWMIRPIFLKHLDSAGNEASTNVKALIGRRGIVSDRIDPVTEEGRVNVGGENWWAVSPQEIEAGCKVEVVRVEGTKLHVKKVEEEN